MAKPGRPGASKGKKKGPTKGTGGLGRKSLEGKGPTPKAEDRPYHRAHKAKKRVEKQAAARPRKGPRVGGGDEWVAGRNSVVEALRADLPVTALYVAEGVEPVENTKGALRWRVGDACVPVDRAQWWAHRRERQGGDPMAEPSSATLNDVPRSAIERVRRTKVNRISFVLIRQQGGK